MKVRYCLVVRTDTGRRFAVGVRPIISEALAMNMAELLARFLATTDIDLGFEAHPRFAWATLDALAATEVDRNCCVVRVVRRTGHRSKTVASIPVTEAIETVRGA